MRLLPIILLAACAHYAPFQPATVSAPPDAFSKAVRVLVERGESVETKDESAGVVVTAWQQQEFMGSVKRLRWTVTVASGTVTVTSQCKTKMSGDPAPGQANAEEDCGNQPDDRSAQARQIAEAIGK